MPAILPLSTAIPRPGTLFYERLRGLARKHLAHERRNHTLQPTALAHEAFLRLNGQVDWRPSESAELLIRASGIMRAILVDHARRKNALKRGGEFQRMSWSTGGQASPQNSSLEHQASCEP